LKVEPKFNVPLRKAASDDAGTEESISTSRPRPSDGSWMRRDTENIIVLGDSLHESISWSIIMACNGARSTAVSSASCPTPQLAPPGNRPLIYMVPRQRRRRLE